MPLRLAWRLILRRPLIFLCPLVQSSCSPMSPLSIFHKSSFPLPLPHVQQAPIASLFLLIITYGVCKKRKYCNRMSEKKNSLLLTNFYDFYVLEDETSKKKFPSVCLSVRTWTVHVDTITFEGVSGSKQNLVGVFYV